MSHLVDFLPPDYRESVLRRRDRKYRLMLVVTVAAALMVTESMFRQRLQGVRGMARLASEHAETRSLQLTEVRNLEQRLQQLRHEIQEVATPLDHVFMTDVLDGLLRGRNDQVRFHELWCSIDPIEDDPSPVLKLEGFGDNIDSIATCLEHLNDERSLPALLWEPSGKRGSKGVHEFRFACSTPVVGWRE